MSALFAATYPERTSALVLYGAMARFTFATDYPWGPPAELIDRVAQATIASWGRADSPIVSLLAPSLVGDDRFRQFWARFERAATSPGAFAALTHMNAEIDIRHVLSTIHVPTLVLHRSDDVAVCVEQGRYVAKHIPGAKYVELPGADHLAQVGDADAIVEEIEEFLTGVRSAAEFDRVLATVLFTDIVGSTERAAALGDQRWRELLEEHHALVRREIARFRGHEVKTAGDGFLATFDGPARGIRCARSVVEAVRPLGLEIRAGLHTGECERMGDDIGGIAVHIGARVAASAQPGEVLVSSTVRDLVAGSGLRFADRGTRILKGVPDEWRLFAVEA